MNDSKVKINSSSVDKTTNVDHSAKPAVVQNDDLEVVPPLKKKKVVIILFSNSYLYKVKVPIIIIVSVNSKRRKNYGS